MDVRLASRERAEEAALSFRLARENHSFVWRRAPQNLRPLPLSATLFVDSLASERQLDCGVSHERPSKEVSRQPLRECERIESKLGNRFQRS
jgi:hypothetical protein